MSTAGHGQPELTLFEWVSEAFAEKLEREATRYPGYPALHEVIDNSSSERHRTR